MNASDPVVRSPQQHIADIRRDKFRLDGQGRLISENPLAEDLHHAVDHLAEGLSSKDVHFVLELIQNAEDNQYAPGVRPELIFRLLPKDPTGTPGAEGALLIVNNERGLRPEDVNALCAVGQSTKTKRQGYIGEKGIGFKSVFRVTRRPHLFSAGYQFYFDREEDPVAKLGYIVPYWVDNVPQVLAAHRNATCILLPLDAGQREPVTESLARIAPETILFLSRIEALTVELPDQPPLQLVVDKSKAPLVELLDHRGLAVYWVHQREVLRPADLSEEKRNGIDTRTVSVAFPLETAEEPEYSVFAYLPTELRSGLPFLVNADFLLTSSREAILVDRPWNRWLRDEIAPCFVKGFVQLIHDESYRWQAYRFIPLPREANDAFFKPVAEQINVSLRQQPVVWVLGRAEPVTPSQARLAPPIFRVLLDGQRPQPGQLQSTPLVRPELERFAEQLQEIGVRPLSPVEVRACLQDQEWLRDRPPEWFLNLYTYLQTERWCAPEWCSTEANSLRDLPIIPTQDGRLAMVGHETVYLPAEGAQTMVQHHAELLGGLAVGFLSADLYRLLESQPGLLDWVERNLAKPWTAEWYARDLVSAMVQKADRLSPDQLVNATQIVRDLTEKLSGEERRRLCAELPLLLDDGCRTTLKEGEVVTPANLDPEKGWQVAFPDPEDRVGLRILSDRYLADCTEQAERSRWTAFFKALGLTDTPIPKRVWEWDGWHHPPPDMPAGLRRRIETCGYSSSSRGFFLEDVRPPRWLEMAATGKDVTVCSRVRSRALLQWLKRGVGSNLIQKDCSLKYLYRPRQNCRVESELYRLLCIAPWFPTTKGFHRPGEAFLDKPEIREIFGDTVPYADDKEMEPKLAEWLGVHSSATTDEVLKYLEQLADKPAATADAKLVGRIYSFLHERWQHNPSSAASRFAQKPMILVSHPVRRWMHPANCIWADRTDVSGADFAYLESNYPPTLREFFVEQLNVKADLDDELYARAWLKLQGEAAPDPARVEPALERIFPVLRRVAANSQSQPPWWSEFLSKARVWTQDHCFVVPAKAFIPDDQDLKSLLGAAGVRFVWRPEKDSFADNEALYRALGVRPLTEAVQCRLADVGDSNTAPAGAERYLSTMAKKALCFYLRNRYPDRFEQLRENGALEAVLRAREVQVERLELHYTLGHVHASDPQALAYFDRAIPALYLSTTADEPELENEIPIQLSRALFGTNRAAEDLKNFIASILGKTDHYLEVRIRREGWDLPKEDAEWLKRVLAQQQLPTQPDVGETEAQEMADLEALGVGQAHLEEAVPTQEEHVWPDSPQPTAAPSTPTDGRDTAPAQPSSVPSLDEATPRSFSPPVWNTAGDAQLGRRSLSRSEARPTSDSHDEPQPRRPVFAEARGAVERSTPMVDPEKRQAVEQAGIQAVMNYEIARGRRPRYLGERHVGYDIESFAAHTRQGDPPDRRIEVKATEGEWQEWGVALTPRELRAAQNWPETYYLYVVEHALDPTQRRIHVFRDPVAKITEYRFSDNWRAWADESG